tara:strand:+ start:321 stop:602 length:282 start_codon:yes stop_codon:yes gene_type:complete
MTLACGENEILPLAPLYVPVNDVPPAILVYVNIIDLVLSSETTIRYPDDGKPAVEPTVSVVVPCVYALMVVDNDAPTPMAPRDTLAIVSDEYL